MYKKNQKKISSTLAKECKGERGLSANQKNVQLMLDSK